MSLPAKEIDGILRQAKLGDDRAVALLMERFHLRLKRMVRLRMDARLSARLDPSDVIQEAFITASQRIHAYLETGGTVQLEGYATFR